MPITSRRAPAILQHDDIACRIPHQGSMCLLDQVSAWDLNQIHCEASNHRSPGHPLRAHGRLGASCGIEYAAQAMAVHGALIAEDQDSSNTPSLVPRMGYLVSLRGVTLDVERLDDAGEKLSIHAERLSGDTTTVLYSFTVHGGPKLLLAGRAAVVLNAEDLTPPLPTELPVQPAASSAALPKP